jgi:tRNA 2-thiouridine synthesizing protein B
MSTLHIIANSTADSAALTRCLYAAAPGDSVLLIGNGVYCAVAADFERFRARANDVTWYALSEDLDRRGVADRLPETVRRADDADFVDLVASHQPIVSWPR